MKVSWHGFVLLGVLLLVFVGCGDPHEPVTGEAATVAAIPSDLSPAGQEVTWGEGDLPEPGNIVPQPWPTEAIAKLEPERYTGSVDRRKGWDAEAITGLLDQAFEQDTDLMIRLVPGADLADLEAIRGLTVEESMGFGTGIHRVVFERGRTREIAAALSELAAADTVGVNAKAELDRVSIDPALAFQHALGSDQANVFRAWDLTTSGDGVVVAILDGKVDTYHQDLRANTMAPVDMVIETQRGVAARHGTHVAGIIGATGNNGFGVAGVCWTANMLPITVFADDDFGSTFKVVRAIYYAVGRNAKVINMSFGYPDSNSMFFNALNFARRRDVLVVASAGNASSNNDVTPHYPASYRLGNIISVGAIDARGRMASFSNYGRSSVDIAAPGERILSTSVSSPWRLRSATYDFRSGTSFAAPMVSGAAALLRTRYPTDPYWRTRARLMAGARRVSGVEGKVRWGVLDVARSLGLGAR